MNSTQEVLNDTNGGYNIYRYYLGEEFKGRKAIKSPFREDKHPSFSIYKCKDSNKWLFKDHARDDVKGDALKFVQLMFDLDFKSALDMVVRDMSIIAAHKYSESVVEDQNKDLDKESTYEIKEKDWSVKEHDFFAYSGINYDTLVKYNVVPASSISFTKEGRVIPINSTEDSPIFLYKLENAYKVYQPNSKHRFMYLGKKPEVYVFGLEQLPNTGVDLIITGGEKDVMALSAHGFNAICFNSETANFPKEVVSDLRIRFRNIIICYDMDKTGVEASKKHEKEYGFLRMELPLSGEKESKDISDYFRLGGTVLELENIIDKVVLSKYEKTYSYLEGSMFNKNSEIEKPEPVISIGGEMLLSKGGLGMISGKVKSGKSAATYAIIGGAITEYRHEVDTLGMDIKPNVERKAVLHLETEQSRYDWHNRFLKVLERAGVNETPDYLISYYLVDKPLNVRKQYIKEMVEYHCRKFKGIHLIVVDGVADLIKSVNDEEASNGIVDFFHRMAAEYNCPILLVLHLNPDGAKMRGHLGSQVERKAECVITVEKDEQVSTIKPKYLRNADEYSVEQPSFVYDVEKGMHVFHGMKSHQDRAEQRKAEYMDVLDEIFENDIMPLSKSDFKEILGQKLDIKRSAVFNALRYMLDNNMIIEKDKMIRRVRNAA